MKKSIHYLFIMMHGNCNGEIEWIICEFMLVKKTPHTIITDGVGNGKVP